jgi:thiol-disulfide isomerase/thioredoxin
MALPYQEYVDMLGNNLNIHELHYKKFSIDKKIAAKISGYKRLIILIITEPWCGDSLALLPIIRKIAEVNGRWGIKILLRDSNLKIMDQFLSRGVRSIPIFLFLDDQGELLFRWGPRLEVTAQIFENHCEQIAQGKIEKQDVIKKIRVYYAKDRGMKTLTELIRVFDEHNL